MKMRAWWGLLGLACAGLLADDLTEEVFRAVDRTDVLRVWSLLDSDPSLTPARDTNQCSLLHHAAAGGSRELVIGLLQRGLPVTATNEFGSTPLLAAAMKGRLETIPLLVEAGADVNAVASDGTTALHHAAARDDQRLARYLTERGAKVNQRTAEGITPLLLAIDRASWAAAEVLLSTGAEVNGRGPQGMTPLCMAARQSDLRGLQLLLAAGANPNLADDDGDAPLHYAAGNGQREAARLLLEKGADPRARNKLRFRPADVVSGRENDALATLLEPPAAGGGGAATLAPGSRRDPRRLRIVGMQSLAADALREALAWNVDFLAVSHPSVPVDDYLAFLRAAVTQAYRHVGFAEVEVETQIDAQSHDVEVRVREGRRWRCGEWRVEGLKQLKPAAFRQMTESVMRESVGDTPPPAEVLAPGTWEAGKPAPFDQVSLALIGQSATNALARLGYFGSKLDIQVVPAEQTDKAALVIKIQSEGTPIEPGLVDVRGLSTNSRGAVLDLIDWKPNRHVDAPWLNGALRKLLECGRFVSANAMPAATPDGASRLQLELVEAAGTPALGARLTPVQQALLHFAGWAGEATQRGEDLAINLRLAEGESRARLRAALDPDGGLGVILEVPAPGHPEQFVPRYAGMLSRRGVTLRSFVTGRFYEMPALNTRLTLGLRCVALAAGEADQQQWSMTIGVAAAAKEFKAADGPFTLHLDLQPAYFLQAASQPDSQVQVREGVLDWVSGSGRVRADARSGRLSRFTYTNSDLVQLLVEIEPQRGALERLSGQLRTGLGQGTNTHVSGQSLGSLLRFVAAEVPSSAEVFSAWQAETNSLALARGFAALGHWLSLGALAELTAPAPAASEPATATSGLWIPRAFETGGADSLGATVLLLGPSWLGDSTWLARLVRGMGFFFIGRPALTGMEIERLHQDPATGPVTAWVVVQALRAFRPDVAREFVMLGLSRLETEYFRQDAEALLLDSAPVSRCLARLFADLGRLSPTEAEALASLLPEKDHRALLALAEVLRGRGDRPLTAVLRPALDAWWEAGLRERVQTALRESLRELRGGRERLAAQ